MASKILSTTTATSVPSPPIAAPQPVTNGRGGGGSFTDGSFNGFTLYGRAASAGSNASESNASGSEYSARRPSPWHDIAHSLSTTSLPPRSRRGSVPGSISATPPFTPCVPDSDAESQALRDWDRLLAAPDSDVTRHALVTAGSGSPHLIPGTPKLIAERDKEGHIEYKLKLIEPSPERFEKLVTQMMWRLKQGKNEAIYELGLADDGTVIGLTRAEMDASLQTLERMASEVGATVIVLKEIVLAPSAPVPVSPSHCSSTPWWTRRPDLDVNGKPRKGTRGLGGVLPEVKTRRERLAAAREAKAVASDDHDPFGFGAEGTTNDPRESSSPSATSDDEPTPFTLDMDDGQREAEAAAAAADAAALAASRSDLKKQKAAARREQRRLDLLRGDGTSTMPYTSRSSSVVAEFIGHAPNTSVLSRLPHQPARPSSLRLARTHSSSTPDDTFIDGLALPLDNLSLSFADVVIDDSPTVVASPEDRMLSEEEMICVEALVVRKPQNGEWGYDAEGWTFGGEDDGWGFGGDE